ncbi:hypothetical protein KVT40_004833 [Elsinoe batatas]|uniref:Uncharacterized protein n=1 Tax=Elsinoe batatas TaxID=2601811 RepID=A0A8K0L1T3_9PEZI|nr:hypothetical protein KVT40_004833 [Elsinoe batatas]
MSQHRDSAIDQWQFDFTDGPITERLLWPIPLGSTSPTPSIGGEDIRFVSPHARPVLEWCDELFGDNDNAVDNKNDSSPQQTDQSTAVPNTTLPANDDGTAMAKRPDDQISKPDSDSMPSLDLSIASRTEDSVSTGDIRAENMRQTALAQAGPPSDPTLHMQCPFYFLDCSMHFTKYSDWKDHCNSHLKRASPPTSMSCAHCQTSAPWDHHLAHLWRGHKGYHNLSAIPFDKRLLMTLLKKRIIDVSEYQILLNDGKLEHRKGAPLALMHNPAQELRRRDGKDRPHAARPFEPRVVDQEL